MSLAPFFSRAADAAGPLLGSMSRSALADRLEATPVALTIDESHVAIRGQLPGFLLAVNLAARLYPALCVDAPEPLLERARALARAINPQIALLEPGVASATGISWGIGEPAGAHVVVGARGWNALLDVPGAAGPASPAAAMAAAALAAGELFRAVFADVLADRGRVAPNPYAINLVTFSGANDEIPLAGRVELGSVHLAGAGAVGQAVVATLRELDVSGTLAAVDPELLDLGNLQRYVLSTFADVSAGKAELVERALQGTRLRVVPVPTAFGADARSHPSVETLLSALDTKTGRIELAAGLPREAFNAWTQAEDLGVSWHETFGVKPCLACLYWPRGARPSRLEMIAEALGEHELRISPYLLRSLPVGLPLRPDMIAATRNMPLPAGYEGWVDRSLLDDIAKRFRIDPAELEPFRHDSVERLYRDGVCGGLLLQRSAGRPREVSVPLAHQSALAGILLATTLVAARSPELRRHRPESSTQARYDVLRGGTQLMLRARERSVGCLCGDPDFRASYERAWDVGAPAGS